MEKILQPIFVDINRRNEWDDVKAETLRNCGYELIFIPEPEKALQSLPVAPLVLKGDLITRCLLKAVNSHKSARDAFGHYVLAEITKANTEEKP